MRRILFLMSDLNNPSEVFMRRQIRMLNEAKVLEAIITTDSDTSCSWSGDIPIISLGQREDYRLRTHVVQSISKRLRCRWRSRTELENLDRLLRSTRADTILCQYGTNAVRLKSVLCSSHHSLFVHVHGFDTSESMCPPGYRESLVSLTDKATIICNSLETFRRLRKWDIPQSKLVVKYCGVEVPPTPLVRTDSSNLTILQLGRLVDCKSPDRTIQAFELACEQGLIGRLVIAGDGPLRLTCELLRARSIWRDRIELLGAITAEDASKLLLSADIFTMHSIQGELTGQVEALGVSILEAMAFSLPVVSCRIGGVVETVIDNETGFLIEPGNIRAQATAFLHLGQDYKLRQRMGAAGWQRAKNNFSYEKERAELLRILKCEH